MAFFVLSPEDLCNHLVSVKNYMRSVQMKPCFEAAANKQYTAIEQGIESSQLDVDYASKISNLISSIPWPRCDMEPKLLELVSTRIEGTIGSKTSSKSVLTQDFTKLPLYLKVDRVAKLFSTELSANDKLYEVVISGEECGLQSPSEHTVVLIVAMSLFVAVHAPSGTGSARPTEIPPTRTAFPHRMDDSRTACSHWTRSIEPIERPHAAHRTLYSLQRRTRQEALTSTSRAVGVRESEQRGMGAAGCTDAVPRSGQGDVCEAGVHAVTE
jgi:hypothetical protein